MAIVLLIVIYIAFVGLGLPDSLLGAAWPVAYADLNTSIGLAGLVSIVSLLGTVISSLCSERLIKRFGTGVVTAASVFLTAAALMGMSVVKDFYVVLLLAVPLGLGGGTVDSALNNFVALHYKASHMSWLHCFWGIGATAGPMIMGAYLLSNNWHGAYRTVSLALFGIVLLLVLSIPLWKRMTKPVEGEEEQSRKPIPKRELLKRPGAIFACLAFLAYCGAEYTSGLWASTYFVEVKGVTPDVAATWASMFYFGITAGRLLSGFAAMKLNDKMLVRIGECIIVVGAVILLLPLPGLFPVAGLLLMGLGCAPIFPSLLDETPKLFGAKYSQGMMGIQMASAYVGGALFSPMFGWISPLIGLGSWPIYLIVFFAILIFATEMTQKRAAKASA